jgi:hypothetical protein
MKTFHGAISTPTSTQRTSSNCACAAAVWRAVVCERRRSCCPSDIAVVLKVVERSWCLNEPVGLPRSHWLCTWVREEQQTPMPRSPGHTYRDGVFRRRCLLFSTLTNLSVLHVMSTFVPAHHVSLDKHSLLNKDNISPTIQLTGTPGNCQVRIGTSCN